MQRPHRPPMKAAHATGRNTPATRALLLRLALGASLLCLPILGGCAAPAAVAVPLAAAQYTATAYQGYDIVCDYAPRERVDFRNTSGNPMDRILRRRISERLSMDPVLKDSDIEVFAFNNRVYLVGRVRTREESDRAADIASHAQGVRSVTRHIVPLRPGDAPREVEGPLENAVLNRAAPDMNARTAIAVDMIGSTVVIMGSAPTPQAKARMEDAARATPGVTGVVSYLVVETPPAPAGPRGVPAPTLNQTPNSARLPAPNPPPAPGQQAETK